MLWFISDWFVPYSTWQVDEASVVKDVKQFTYLDGDDYVFMDMVMTVVMGPSASLETFNDRLSKAFCSWLSELGWLLRPWPSCPRLLLSVT